ncbi:hypothetical protein APHAL10511_004290 [Amanita phalloides]|nr:hypothetical protein APHAL10511_004290 [Amanita phalloides]
MARAPYNSSAIADVILRSSDKIDYYVVGAFLYYVSPTFRDMFALNRGPAIDENEKKDELPIIDVAEDSETLYNLLEFIYPRVEEPQFNDLHMFRKVSQAAQKYFMTVVEAKLKKQIIASPLLKDEPFRTYVIATDLGWEAIALMAARNTLCMPLQLLPFVNELESITGAEFYRYLEYRYRCDALPSARQGGFTVLTRKMTGFPPVLNGGTNETSPRAPEPFNDFSNGNLVLRSSDSIDFIVIEGLIRFVSPFFDSMFPLQKHQEVDGRPVIAVSEDSKVLHGLLSIIYPHADEHVTQNFDLYKSVVWAARKYRMSTIEKKLQKVAMTSSICKEPLRLYALATCLGWDEVAKMAALETFSQPLQGMTYVEELDQITGADLHRLVRYRFNCADAACRTVKDSKVHTSHGFLNLTQKARRLGESITRSHHNNRLISAPLTINVTGKELICNCVISTPLSVPSSLFTSGEVSQKLKDFPRGATYSVICASEFARLTGHSSMSSQLFMQVSALDEMAKYGDGIAEAIEDAISKVCPTESHSSGCI